MDVLAYFSALPAETSGQRAFLTRIGNQLHRGGIRTMEQLCAARPEQFQDIRNIGEKGLALTLAIRAQYGQEHG